MTTQLALIPPPAADLVLCEFFVDGFPKPKGNLAARSIPGSNFATLYDKTKGLPEWLKAIRVSASWAMHCPPSTRPIRLDVWFYFLRPDTHYTSKGALSAQGRRFPFPLEGVQGGKAGDFDKLVRAIADALQGGKGEDAIAFENDRQVAEAHIYREWGEREGARVIVSELA